MSWPRTGTGSLASGYVASGVTSIRWGSGQVVTSVAGTAVNGTTVGIVNRIHERSLIENMKFGNGDGPTITRVQIVDGVVWDLSMRDDTGITNRPKAGTDVIVVDMAGLLGNVGLIYHATVIETGYEVSPKSPGEIPLTVENLLLVESQSGS